MPPKRKTSKKGSPRRAKPAAPERPGRATTFLLEIGCEELPPAFCRAIEYTVPGERDASDDLRDLLAQKGIGVGSSEAFATPRRIIFDLIGLDLKMDVLEREVLGPPKHVAFDAAGKPTKAAEGFAQKIGCSIPELYVRETDRGAYLSGKLKFTGSLEGILRDALPPFILSLADSFPKRMKWGTESISFVRPIRWIAATLDDRVLSFTVGSVTSGNLSYPFGRRPCFGDTPRPIPRSHRYYDSIPGSTLARTLFPGPDYQFDEDLPFMYEKPVLGTARLPDLFQDLPPTIVHTILVHQMKCLRKHDAPPGEFTFAAEGPLSPGAMKNAQSGYEALACARLTDALYFYRKDSQIPLADRVESLKSILFLQGAGTLYDKTRRLRGISLELNSLLGNKTDPQVLSRAAELSRADQTTHMVREITDLEGIMGQIYADRTEPREVGVAIRESYLPRGATDDIPRSPGGILLSLADKMDNLLCFFSTKIRPTGSKDPLGFRRNAAGMLRTLDENHLSFPIETAFDKAAATSGIGKEKLPEIAAFMTERFESYARERYFRLDYDVIKAALPHSFRDPVYALDLARFLQSNKSPLDPHFAEVVRIAVRIHNLARDMKVNPFTRETGFQAEEGDRVLLSVFQSLSDQRKAAETDPSTSLASKFDAFVSSVSTDQIRKVDSFFDTVLVMDPNQFAQKWRLSLLYGIDQLFAPFGDLGQLILPSPAVTP